MARCDEVLDEYVRRGIVADEDRRYLNRGMLRRLNMTMDAGRPSDAMRSECEAYGREGADEYRLRINAGARGI